MALKKIYSTNGITGEYWTITCLSADRYSTTFRIALYANETSSKVTDKRGRIGLSDSICVSIPIKLDGRLTHSQIYDYLKSAPVITLIKTHPKYQIKDSNGNILQQASPPVLIQASNLFADAEDSETPLAFPSVVNNMPPITSVFDKYWITRFSTVETSSISAILLPYDGQFVLYGRDRLFETDNLSEDPTIMYLINSIYGLLQSFSQKIESVNGIIVEAPAPDKPVKIVATFADDTIYEITDVFSVAGTDSSVAQLLGGILMWISSKVAQS